MYCSVFNIRQGILFYKFSCFPASQSFPPSLLPSFPLSFFHAFPPSQSSALPPSLNYIYFLLYLNFSLRRCKSAFHKKRSDLVELENPAFDENEESSEFELESVNTTSSIKKENNHSPNGSGFVSITIPDCSDKDPVMIEAEACSTNKDNKVNAFYCSASVAITIAEDKNVITVDTPVQLASSFIVEIPETMLSNGSPSETDSSKLALVPCLSHASQPVETPQGNTLTSEEEPESVIVKIEETADNDDMTVLSASMSSDESSTTSSSSVEAARAVLVTIGTGDQTPAELK